MKEKISHTELKSRGFICTDGSEETEQWVRKISDTKFEVYERASGVMQDIDLDEYTEDEIRDFVSGYYDSLEDLREQYGNDSNLIIAEIISESTVLDSIVWDSMEQKLI
jgi:hypothetical protein